MAQDTLDKVVVVVPDDSGYLNVLRQAVGSTASLMGFDAATVLQLQMALDEACTNVIEHGQCTRGERKIRLKLEALPQKLVMHLQDHCERFSPLEKDVQTLEKYFNSSKTKGLGLVIMHQFIDEIRHSYRSNAGNRLSLTKYLSAGPGSSAGPGMSALPGSAAGPGQARP